MDKAGRGAGVFGEFGAVSAGDAGGEDDERGSLWVIYTVYHCILFPQHNPSDTMTLVLKIYLALGQDVSPQEPFA